MATVADGIFFFQDNEKLYGLIHCKESDEIHRLKIQKIEVSIYFMGYKDGMKVTLALRKPTVHHGD